MGCHTWFYERVNKSEEELKKCLSNVLDDYIISENDTEIVEEIGLLYVKLANIKILRIKRLLNNNTIKYNNLITHVSEYCDKLQLINNILYEDAPYSNLFRTYYTDIVLLSLEKTLQFIEDRNINIDKKYLVLLKQFWIEYPDGAIAFG